MICTGAIHTDGSVSHDGDTCPTHEAALNCIGTKRGLNYGIVYNDAGQILGRVFQTQRRLRGGSQGTAWTAYVRLPDGAEIGCSLGTRHPDRWSAARAIREFWKQNPMLRLTSTATWETQRPLHRALAVFKYDHHDVCGLTARYRGGDPRKMWA